MSKENRTQTLIKVGAEEASAHFNAHITQDEASYNGDVSDADEEDIKVVPDKVDDTQIEGSKPVEADSLRQGSSRSYQQEGWWPNLKVYGQETSSKTQQQGLIWWNSRWSGLLQ